MVYVYINMIVSIYIKVTRIRLNTGVRENTAISFFLPSKITHHTRREIHRSRIGRLGEHK